MSERIYYETPFSGLLGEGVVLRDDYMNDAGEHALLVECVGAAPISEQPFGPSDPWPGSQDIGTTTVREAYEILGPYLAGDDLPDDEPPELQVVWPRDVVRRFVDDDGDRPIA